MQTSWWGSPRASWCLLYGIHLLAIGGGVAVVGYALIGLRVEKMEVIYRSEGVPFAAGPEGVPPEKWQRMSTTELEIVEPMANWILGVAATSVALSIVSLCLLIRASPFPGIGPEPATDAS